MRLLKALACFSYNRLITRAALSTCGRAKSKFLSVYYKTIVTRLQSFISVTAAAFLAGALLLANTCFAASGLEEKQDAKAPVSSAALTVALDSTNAATRFYAVYSLGKIGGSAPIEPLVKALHDPDACVRIAAAKALGQSADPAAEFFLISAFKTEKDADVREVITKPLLDKGPVIIPSFLKILWNAETWEIRGYAADALSKLGWQPRNQEDKIVFYTANIGSKYEDLSAMGPVVIPYMVKLIEEGDEQYRENAIWVLCEIYDSRVFKPLVKALVDPSPAVRKAAWRSSRAVGTGVITHSIGIKGYLLLWASCFLVSLVYVVKKLASYFRHRDDVTSGSSKGFGKIARFARAQLSFDLVVVLSCNASLLMWYIYTVPNTAYERESFDAFANNLLPSLFPVFVMIVVFDIARIIFKAARMFKRETGKALCVAQPLLWLRRIAAVVCGAALIYSFASFNVDYVWGSHKIKNLHAAVQDAWAPMPEASLSPEEEARKFASIVSQAKDAAKAIDTRYLDQQQKEQVMDTFVRLVSIRSPSKEEGLIGDELRQVMETLGAKEIDCRQGDTNAPLNLVMEIPATEDLKDAPGILLNAHIDTIGSGRIDKVGSGRSNMFSADRCTPEGMEFDKAKSNFYHQNNGSFGADDKAGVTMVVEALRTLKRDSWDKGYSHRRILVVFTAKEESGHQGAKYLATHHRELFSNLDFSFTVDGMFKEQYRYPQTPHIAAVFQDKTNTFKAKQVVAIMEKFAKERNKPFLNEPSPGFRIDAIMFPPEAYKIVFFMNAVHGLHTQERVHVGELIDSVDMLINVLVQLEAEYAQSPSQRQVRVGARKANSYQFEKSVNKNTNKDTKAKDRT